MVPPLLFLFNSWIINVFYFQKRLMLIRIFRSNIERSLVEETLFLINFSCFLILLILIFYLIINKIIKIVYIYWKRSIYKRLYIFFWSIKLQLLSIVLNSFENDEQKVSTCNPSLSNITDSLSFLDNSSVTTTIPPNQDKDPSSDSQLSEGVFLIIRRNYFLIHAK
jgi:hypothetical protein